VSDKRVLEASGKGVMLGFGNRGLHIPFEILEDGEPPDVGMIVVL
jgi:hypothetical protein